MKTMVTGGAGFLGSALVERLLAEGHQVDVVDDLSIGSLSNLADARAVAGRALTIHQLDIGLPELVELMKRRRPEIVFHLAAQTNVEKATASPIRDAEVNVIGSVNVLEGARACEAERVVYAASGGTLYGDAEATAIPVRESQPHRVGSPFAAAKKAVLDYLVAYRDLHALEFVALALANVYGPRELGRPGSSVVSVFAHQMVSGEAVTIFGNGNQTRDFVFVDDVTDAFVRAMSRGGGLLCNIGSGREVSINELYQVVAGAAGDSREPVHGAPRAGEVTRSCLNVGRAAIQLGWAPWTSLESGVEAVLDVAKRRRSDLAGRESANG